eukprot:TRINITY_DN27400_c0_g1_i1.p2 TRINITY_DN27400_c0_g1~~TRINITY_DN27400_c0_g1_i1.p2  ORF type:complete len:119 (-),score=7.00 TRINITY_DN27400_c0_g1_i1:138-494(-)
MISCDLCVSFIHKALRSWSEPVYSHAISNACWELYGIEKAEQYPRVPPEGMMYDLRVSVDPVVQGTFNWTKNWRTTKDMSCPGHPVASLAVRHSSAQEDVFWTITNNTAEHADAQIVV